jgi:predicted Zn-dependent peptidase
VETIMLDTIASLKGTIKEDEVERVKNKLATSLTLQGENPGGRMRGLGTDWCYTQTYEPLDEKLSKIMAVTVADLEALLAAWPFHQPTLVRLGPKP